MIIVTVGLQSPGEFWSNEEDDMEKETYLGCKKILNFFFARLLTFWTSIYSSEIGKINSLFARLF